MCARKCDSAARLVPPFRFTATLDCQSGTNCSRSVPNFGGSIPPKGAPFYSVDLSPKRPIRRSACIIACPLENFDATGFVVLPGVRSYVASLPSDQDRAGTGGAPDKTCATCHRKHFQHC